MRELLGANAPDCLDEILNRSSKVVIRGGSRNGNRVVRHPSYGLCYSLGIGGNVPDTIATVVMQTGAKVIFFSSMRVP